MLKFDVKLEGLEEAKKMFSPDLLRKTVRSATDRTLTYGKNLVIAAVTGRYNIGKDKFTVTTKRTTQAELAGYIVVRGRQLQLYADFHAAQMAHGAGANVEKGTLFYVHHGFIATTKKGWTGVMARRGKSRYPLTGKVNRIDAVPTLVKSKGIWPSLTMQIQARLDEEIRKEIDKRMRA